MEATATRTGCPNHKPACSSCTRTLHATVTAYGCRPNRICMPSCTQKVPCRSDTHIMHSSHAKFGLTVTGPTVPHSSTHATNKCTKQRSRRCARPRWEGWHPSQLSTRTGWAIPPRWPPSCNCRRCKPVLSQYLPEMCDVMDLEPIQCAQRSRLTVSDEHRRDC